MCVCVYVGVFTLTTDISDEGEQLWIWEYEMDDGKHDLFMDIGEEIRLESVDITSDKYSY